MDRSSFRVKEEIKIERYIKGNIEIKYKEA
jgi:hypothetical protein